MARGPVSLLPQPHPHALSLLCPGGQTELTPSFLASTCPLPCDVRAPAPGCTEDRPPEGPAPGTLAAPLQLPALTAWGPRPPPPPRSLAQAPPGGRPCPAVTCWAACPAPSPGDFSLWAALGNSGDTVRLLGKQAGVMRGPGSGDGGSARGRRTSSSTAMPSPWPESPGDGVRRAGRGDSGVQGWEAGEGTWAVESETRPCSGPDARRKLLSPGAPLGGSEPPVLGAQSRDPLARWGCSASKVWRAPRSECPGPLLCPQLPGLRPMHG